MTSAGRPLDDLVRRYAAPLLKQHGYRKEGRGFRRVGDSGDVAMVWFTPGLRLGDGVARFWVGAGVGPVPFLAWLRHDRPDDARAPQPGELLGTPPIPPPEHVWGAGAALHPSGRTAFDSPRSTAEWAFRVAGEPSVEVCGEAVEQTLREHALPLLERLRDRRELVASLREGGGGAGSAVLPRYSAEATALVLVATDGPFEDVVRLLDAVVAFGDPRELEDVVPWVREVLRERGQPTMGRVTG